MIRRDEEALECKTGADPIQGVPRDGVVSFALCKGRLGGAAAPHSCGAGRLAGGRGWLFLLTRGIVLQRDARGAGYPLQMGCHHSWASGVMTLVQGVMESLGATCEMQGLSKRQDLRQGYAS